MWTCLLSKLHANTKFRDFFAFVQKFCAKNVQAFCSKIKKNCFGYYLFGPNGVYCTVAPHVEFRKLWKSQNSTHPTEHDCHRHNIPASDYTCWRHKAGQQLYKSAALTSAWTVQYILYRVIHIKQIIMFMTCFRKRCILCAL